MNRFLSLELNTIDHWFDVISISYSVEVNFSVSAHGQVG